MANAFPSVKTEALDNMVDECADLHDKPILKARYTKSQMIIETPTKEKICVHPKCGGLQGDSIMANMFRAAYDEKIQEWIKAKMEELGDDLLAWDPVTEQWIYIGTTSYADDIGDTNLVEHVRETVEVIEKNNELLNTQLRSLGLEQNRDKEEHVPKYNGKEAFIY